MKNNKELLTVIMVSYYSHKMIYECIKTIPSNLNILIVNNALEDDLKSKINYKKNLKILQPPKNLGNGGGANFALNLTKTKYAIYIDVDTRFESSIFDQLLNIAQKENDWAIISPNISNYNYKNEFIIKHKNEYLSEMKFVEGCALLFNLNKIKKLGFYDENFFLYYEEDDLFFRYIKANLKILLAKKIFIQHIGNSSVDTRYKEEIELNRNWHLMWSKFYFYKKNYSYFTAIFQTYKSLVSSFLKTIFYFLIKNKKYKIYLNRLSGLINSYIGNSSSRRPKI